MLFGVELCRVTMVERATRSFARRHALAGAQVVMATTYDAVTAIFDVVLQEYGAVTFDFVHGTTGDGWPGGTDTAASYRLVWSAADVAVGDPARQTCIVAGLPRPRALPRKPLPRAARRVLIMSNYVHRDMIVEGVFAQETSQLEMLRFAGLIRKLRPDVEVRWRPHPADAPAAVRRGLDAFGPLEVSRGAPLENDLAWCDVVVSSPSSAVFEALFADAPLFLHAHPELWGTPVTRFLDRERVFFYADDAAPRVLTALAGIEAGDANVLVPERAARVRLFGPDGEPPSVAWALEHTREALRPAMEDAVRVGAASP
jgi:hypothetical protein